MDPLVDRHGEQGDLFLAGVQFLYQMGSNAHSVKKGSFLTGTIDLTYDRENFVVGIQAYIFHTFIQMSEGLLYRFWIIDLSFCVCSVE